ncbi:MAG: hypothetical protein ABSC63_09225 [Candidatus Binataceae bacterium]|jgi:hypothetical protein
MADENDKHTPESIAAKVIKALLKARLPKKQSLPIAEQTQVKRKRARKGQ